MISGSFLRAIQKGRLKSVTIFVVCRMEDADYRRTFTDAPLLYYKGKESKGFIRGILHQEAHHKIYLGMARKRAQELIDEYQASLANT